MNKVKIISNKLHLIYALIFQRLNLIFNCENLFGNL